MAPLPLCPGRPNRVIHATARGLIAESQVAGRKNAEEEGERKEAKEKEQEERRRKGKTGMGILEL